MASFDIVNYSLRPSKGIQRQIVFDGIRMLKSRLELSEMIYVGLGSIWFSDFVQAHKSLDIRRMVSIEADDTGYCRARFNKPLCNRAGAARSFVGSSSPSSTMTMTVKPIRGWYGWIMMDV